MREWLEDWLFALAPELRGGEEDVEQLAAHVHMRLSAYTPPPDELFNHGAAGLPSFVDGLRQAAGSATYWDEKWGLVSREESWAFVTDGVVTVFVPQTQDLQPRDASPGALVSVRLPCARPNLTPGTFTVVSRAGRVRRHEPPLTFVLNLEPDGAPSLLRTLVQSEPLEAVRFEAQVVNDPAAYQRRDTALLHVELEGFQTLWDVLSSFQERHVGAFREETVPFARKLSRGLGVAEGVAHGTFLEHRSQVVSRALLRALRAGRPPERWVDEVQQELADAGVSLATPHLVYLRETQDDSGALCFRFRPP